MKTGYCISTSHRMIVAKMLIPIIQNNFVYKLCVNIIFCIPMSASSGLMVYGVGIAGNKTLHYLIYLFVEICDSRCCLPIWQREH